MNITNEMINEIRNKIDIVEGTTSLPDLDCSNYLFNDRLTIPTSVQYIENDTFESFNSLKQLNCDPIHFDEFTYGTLYTPPMFIPYERDEKGMIEYGEGVVPFTPRTLELCIIRMTDNCKAEAGLFLREFEQRCRKIAEESCFSSENWDKVIGYGKEMVKAKYLETEWGQEIEK